MRKSTLKSAAHRCARSARLVFGCVAVIAACGAKTSTPTTVSTLAATTCAESHSAPAPRAVDLPKSPPGDLARALLDAVNSGKDDDLRAFLKEHLSDKALKDAPFDEWFTYFQDMAKQSGGVDVVSEALPRGPARIVFDIRARRIGRYATVRLFMEAPGKVRAFDASPKDDPATSQRSTLPSTAMSEADAVRAITGRVEHLGATDRFSGAVLVVKGDRVLVSLTQGQAEKAFAAPNRIDTKFNLGSMNKMFTAISIAELVEKGKLAFTDTLIKVLPDYPNKPFAESVTLHQLLTHTSGIGGTIFAPPVFEHRSEYKRPTDYIPLFANEPPEFPPGTRFSYANQGFMILGAIVERIAGENYFDYVQNHVFAPAGMQNTASYAWNEVTPNLAVGYVHDDNDVFALKPRRTNVAALPFRGSPAGGGYSTVQDLRAFADALRRHKLLSAAMTETVTSPKVDIPGGPPRKYGYGFGSRVVHGKEIRGHGGGAPGINGALDIFWDGSYIVVVLGNYAPPVAQDLAAEITEFLAAQDTK
jgi:CubicO group peptidase (beta-lactamase class C family)